MFQESTFTQMKADFPDLDPKKADVSDTDKILVGNTVLTHEVQAVQKVRLLAWRVHRRRTLAYYTEAK